MRAIEMVYSPNLSEAEIECRLYLCYSLILAIADAKENADAREQVDGQTPEPADGDAPVPQLDAQEGV